MKTRKIITLFLILALSFTCISCSNTEEQKKTIKPQALKMKSIFELATMECYYHNVAKYKEKDAEGILLWKKDKNFWIEYSGVVKIGIDASLVIIKVEENSVIITIPNAKVLDKKVDNSTLNKDSFIVDKKSADISAEDEIKAFGEAQEQMVKAASEDTVLLASAQERAQTLLEEYVKNIGNAIGKEYSIEWKYIGTDGQGSTNTAKESSDSKETKESK